MTIFQEISEACHFLLKNEYPGSEEVRDELSKRIEPESIDKFQFGYFPNEWNLSSLISLVGKEKLIESKMLYEHSYVHYYDDYQEIEKNLVSNFKDYNLIFPYKDAYGKVIGLVARALNYENLNISKYKNTSFKKSQNLFGLDLAKKSILEKDFVYIVEGQFDLIKALERGITNILAVGTSSLSIYQLSMILRYTKNISILFDNDEGGDKGRKKIISQFKNYANFVNFYVPDPFKDLDDYLKSLDKTEKPEFIFRG